MQTYVKQQYIVLNDLRDGEKGSIFVALIFNYIIQTFRLISFGNYFVSFKGWFVKIGLFFQILIILG